MKMTTVSSTSIDRIGYDGTTQTLRVRFQNQSIYDYKNVPRDVFDGLLRSESLGTYLNREIRNRFPVIQLRNIN